MAAFDIQEELTQINTLNKYLYLGDKGFYNAATPDPYINEKIVRLNPQFDEKFWGTLGNFDDSKIEWNGTLFHSSLGQFNSTGITAEIKEYLVQATGTVELETADIRERYISFDAVDFNEAGRSNNELRLTLFLNNNEGAVVYYQYYDTEEADAAEGSKGVDYDFIFPEATKNAAGQVDFNVNNRDRLSYAIDILPKLIQSAGGKKTTMEKLRFVVKILSFKREAKSIKEIIEKSEERIFGSNGRYKLMVFSSQADAFVEPKKGVHEIDAHAKTLFLIHGTFSETKKSFGALIDKQTGNPSLLKQYLNHAASIHTQAIAFDHPTLFDDATENTRRLMEELDRYEAGFAFTQRLDLIGTSRGAVVAKYLAMAAEQNKGENPKIQAGKIITVSGANGCGYLTKGKYFVNVALKLLKKGTPAQIALVALAQVSVTYITTRGGLQLITPGHPKLTSILQYKPPANSPVQVLTLCADFDAVKTKGIGKKLKNLALRMGDKLVQTMLGKQHDFVIGTLEQGIAAPFKPVLRADNPLFNAVHGKVLGKPGAWKLITDYLMQ